MAFNDASNEIKQLTS